MKIIFVTILLAIAMTMCYANPAPGLLGNSRRLMHKGKETAKRAGGKVRRYLRSQYPKDASDLTPKQAEKLSRKFLNGNRRAEKTMYRLGRDSVSSVDSSQ